jgi:hypothetical protein
MEAQVGETATFLRSAHAPRPSRFLEMRRSLTVAVLACVVVVSAPGIASAKSLPAAQWVPRFCAALSTFQSHLASDGTRADAVLSGDITSLAEAKSALVAFMGRAVRDADAALSALGHAGTPNTVNGAKIAARFVKGFQTVRGLYGSARTAAQHLATKTFGAFESGTKSITSALEKGGRSIESSFASIQLLDKGGTLGAALRAEPTCAFLQGTTPTTTTATS